MKKSPIQVTKERFGGKAELVKSIKELATEDLWIDRVNGDKGLERVSNRKLQHLHDVLTKVKAQFGTRTGLVDAIVALEQRTKDSDYRQRFLEWSTPKLWDYFCSKQKTSKQSAAKAS